MSRSTAHSSDARALKERMRGELRWLRLRLISHAVLMFCGGIGVLTAVAMLSAPAWTRLGPAGAWMIWVAVAFGTLWLSYFEVLDPLRRIANLKGFSRMLERYGSYGNLIEAATQFSSPRKEDPLRWGASPELVEEIMRRARAEAERTLLAPRIPLQGAPAHLVVAAVAMLLWFAAGWLLPARVELGLAALADPSILETRLPQSGIYPLSGDTRVAIGGDLDLLARDFTDGDGEVALLINRTGDFWQESSTELLPPLESPASYRDLVARVAAVEDPFRYRFKKGSILSPIHGVEVRERPVLRELGARLTPPEYSGRPPQEREDLGGSVAVLVGTVVELEGRATAELSSARREIEDGVVVELQVDGDRFVDRFVVEQDLSFRIALEDVEGLSSAGHTIYRFIAQPDDPPTVEITRPSEDLTLDRDLSVGIAGLAADDVALRRLELLHRTEEETQWRHIPLFANGRAAAERADMVERLVEIGEREVAVAFAWVLAAESLFPGDTMLFCLEATDNNALVGGQKTRSEIFRLSLPTISEIFDAEREERAEDRGELAELRDEGEELQETLERLNRELKKDPNPDWAKQQEIKDALERQEALKEKLQEAADRLQQDLQQFEENNAGSMELMEKMETIQQLLENLEDESLQAYLEAMQEAMDQLLPHEIQRAMEDALGNQEEYNRRLDRTIELLQQLERERTMSDLVEALSENLERQEKLLAHTEGQTPRDEAGETGDSEPEASDSQEEGDGDEREMSDDELARAQEKLAEQAKELEEKIRKALEELKEQQEKGHADDPSAEKMEESLEQAEEQMTEQGNPSDAMQDAQRHLQEGERDPAADQQQESIRRLLYLYETLAEGQQAMQQATQQYAVEKLQQTAFDLLQLSFGEEVVAGSLEDAATGQRLAPISREQGRIQRSTAALSQSLHELARNNFMVPEALLKEMRKLEEMVDQSVDELQLQRSRRARSSATQAMGQMNHVVMNLLSTAMNAGQGGGGGGSPQSLSQQMQGMSQDQSRLNAMTEQLRKQMQDGMSESERQQMAQLRAQQQGLQQRLDEIRRQIEDERRVLGDLDELKAEMEEVVEGFDTGRLDADLRRQQEKILSRMLDAQRSMRERDFAKRRESREGDRLFADQEGTELSTGDPADLFRLRRWLAPEKAPHAYQDDVRRYFRRIQDALDQNERR